ncbi:MAG: hypothetical protein JNL05_13035 [Flavobacteriales bacterium]|nr:hypothetical protein [Flavobacteriales bacterium]
MSTIVDLKGQTLGVVKEQHVPERVARRRMALSKQLHELREQWMADNAPDPEGATKPNAEAIDAHYSEQWRTQARVAKNAQEPVDVDEEAMATWIADQRRKQELHAQFTRQLREVNDLSPWGFKLVGQCAHGTVWLCDQVALAVAEDGLVMLELRSRWASTTDWAGRDRLNDGLVRNAWMHALELPDYTLGELFELLTAMRINKLVPLPEGLMAIARGKQVTAPKSTPTEA